MAKKPVHFSVGLFPYDRWGGIKPIADAAKHADDLGFYGLTFPEHIVMPVRPDVPPVSVMWYDNFVLASHVATLTKRIRLIFNVMVIPYRNPVVAAKLISTLDQVSNGRLTVGVGAGWLRGEFRVLGVNAEERGPLTDEYLRAMKVLWTEANPEFRGKYVSFSRFAFEPKCVQKPHVRLWMGGSGKAPMRRVIEIGDGWAPMTGDLPDLKRDISLIKERAIAAGRDPEALDFSYSLVVGERDAASDMARSHVSKERNVALKQAQSPQEVIELVNAYREAGFNHLGLGFKWEKPADYMRQCEWLAAKVLPAFKG